jgi:hypothetical protein
LAKSSTTETQAAQSLAPPADDFAKWTAFLSKSSPRNVLWHGLNQGPATVQAMVFEPGAPKLHLAFGAGPATRLPCREVGLGRLFAEGSGWKQP